MLELNFNNPFPILHTDRLTLRACTQADVNEVFMMRSDPRILKYLVNPPATKLEEAAAFIDKLIGFQEQNESINWGISLKGCDKIIGTICYWNIAKAHHRAELGYVLISEYWGNGYMHEAITAVIQYGFKTMKLHSIGAYVNPDNEASIKSLERSGFVREAYFKEDYLYNGQFIDTAVYSLLTPDR